MRAIAVALVAAAVAAQAAAGLGRAPRVTASIQLAPTPVAVSARSGTLWVETTGESTRFFRIDESSGGITAIRDHRPRGIQLAAGSSRLAAFGSLWISDSESGGAVRRVDASTRRTIKAFRMPGSTPWTAPAAAAGLIWIAFGNETKLWLRRIDPQTNAFAGPPIPIVSPAHPHTLIAYALHGARGSVWLVTVDDKEVGDRLWQIDPRHGRVVGSVRIAQGGRGMLPAWDGRWVWLFSDDAAYRVELP